MEFIKRSLLIIGDKEKKKIPLLIFFMFIASFFEVFSISLLVPAVSLLIDPIYKVKLLNYLQSFNISLPNNFDAIFIYIFVAMIFFVFATKFIFMFFFIYFRTNWVSQITIKVANNLFTSYLYRPYKFHYKSRSSKSILSIISEVQALAQNILIPFLEITTEILIILGLFFFIFFYEPVGTLFIVFTGLFSLILYFKYSHSKTKIWSHERRINELNIIKLIQSSFEGIKEVIMFEKRNFFKNEFIQKNIKLNNIFKKQYAILDSTKYIIELVALLSISALLFLLLIFNQSEIKNLIVKLSIFAVIFFKVLPATNRIILAKQRITFALASANNIYEELEYFKLPFQKKVYYKINSINKLTLKKKIELKNINFFYDKKIIFRNLCLNINKGEMIGIIGNSGVGKSTLMNILAGLLEPNEGMVLIDEVPINKKIELWQKNIGYVPQNFFMLDDSIRSNVIFEPNFASTKKDEKIYKTLDKAQILDYVKSLPKKLDTIIGERGSAISVGQAQRFSIARALFRDPDLLILDEATSSLDIQNEKKILNTIINLYKKKTIIIVSHKNTSLKYCDKIYRIENQECQQIS